MATAIALAMQAAVEKRAAQLQDTVREWSADDSVHSDPPLPPPAIEQEKPPMEQDFAPPTTNGAASPPSTAPNVVVADQKEHGTTKGVFLTIRDNPGLTRMVIQTALINAGYNSNSVSSLMGAMVSGKLIKYDPHGGLVTTRKNYRPLGNPYVAKAAKKIEQRKAAEAKPRKKLSKPLRPTTGRKMTRSEAGQMANWQRWGQWNKIAEKWGKEFMQAKRAEFRRLHPNYSVVEESQRLGAAIKAGRAAKKAPLSVAQGMAQAMIRKAAEGRANGGVVRASRMTPERRAEIGRMGGFAKAAAAAARRGEVVKSVAKPTAPVAEKARNAARMLLDNSPPAAHSAAPTQQNTALDLRSMTPDEVMQAMSLSQAWQVFTKLREYFKD